MKYAAHYCWRGYGQERALAMYSALLNFGPGSNEFIYRTDEIGKWVESVQYRE